MRLGDAPSYCQEGLFVSKNFYLFNLAPNFFYIKRKDFYQSMDISVDILDGYKLEKLYAVIMRTEIFPLGIAYIFFVLECWLQVQLIMFDGIKFFRRITKFI